MSDETPDVLSIGKTAVIAGALAIGLPLAGCIAGVVMSALADSGVTHDAGGALFIGLVALAVLMAAGIVAWIVAIVSTLIGVVRQRPGSPGRSRVMLGAGLVLGASLAFCLEAVGLYLAFQDIHF